MFASSLLTRFSSVSFDVPGVDQQQHFQSLVARVIDGAVDQRVGAATNDAREYSHALTSEMKFLRPR